MKYCSYLVFILFVVSCSQENKLPPVLTERIVPDSVTLNDKIFKNRAGSGQDTEQSETSSECLDNLYVDYLNTDQDFNIGELEAHWKKCKSEIQSKQLNESVWKKWFVITGLLFQSSGKANYMEEAENIIITCPFEPDVEMKEIVSSWIFTKNVDHIHVNLFISAEYGYEHSLGGRVGIEQKTAYPETDTVEITFSMETKRYIELYVRIPTWAENAAVTVKGVKYFAQPGEYTRIARKWKDGDLVQVYF